MAITLWKNRAPFEGMMRWFDEDLFTSGRERLLPSLLRSRWPFEDMLRWFDEDMPLTGLEKTFTPALDVEEKDGKYLVRADLPGLKKDDIHVEVNNGMLTLWGERKDEHEEKKGSYRRVERNYGCFQRSFRVPEGVTEKDIHAKYKDGVLELSIPAPKEAKHKAIEVKVE